MTIKMITERIEYIANRYRETTRGINLIGSLENITGTWLVVTAVSLDVLLKIAATTLVLDVAPLHAAMMKYMGGGFDPAEQIRVKESMNYKDYFKEFVQQGVNQIWQR